MLDLDPGIHLEEIEGAVRRRAGTHRCRRRGSPPPWPRPRPQHPSALGVAESPPPRAPPRPASGAGAGSSIRARPDARCARGRRGPGSPRGGAARRSSRGRRSRSPNALSASDAAAVSAPASSPGARTTRMPFAAPAGRRLHQNGEADLLAPPGPLRPDRSPAAVSPGTIGTPAACIRRRASVLSPMARMAPPEGPMKTSPASVTAWANAARSARKP